MALDRLLLAMEDPIPMDFVIMELALVLLAVLENPDAVALLCITTHRTFIDLPVAIAILILRKIEVRVVEQINVLWVFIKELPVTVEFAMLPITLISESA